MMTKTVLNRLVAVLCVVAMAFAAKAQEAQFLIVTEQDGTMTSFALAEAPVLTMIDGTLTIVAGPQTYAVPIQDVVNYKFTDAVTAIDKVEKDTKPLIDAGMAHFENMKPGTPVHVYAIDGRLVTTVTATSGGSVDINLRDLGSGIFIVATPTASYKIQNR